MAMIPDKITFKRITEKSSVCYRHFVFKFKESADVGDEAGLLHEGGLDKKLCGICGFKVDFGEDAGVALDVSKKLLCLYDKFDVTSGADTSPKAEILTPGLIAACMQTICPCGSKLMFRIRDAGAEEDLWHIRTPEVCCSLALCGCNCSCNCCPICPESVTHTFNICPAGKKEAQGTITVTAKTCAGPCMLASDSRISVDFPSEGDSCTPASKHAIMCVAMMLDAALLGSRSFCV